MKPAIFLAAVFFIAPILAAAQQTPAPVTQPTVQHEANFDAERAQANQLYLAHSPLEALPLYEDLCRQDPTNAAFAERHAAGLLAKFNVVAPADRASLVVQAINELHRAQRLGDDSPFVESTLGILSRTPVGMTVMASMGGLPLTVGWSYQGSAAAQPLMQQAQAAFARSDFEAALKLYLACAATDPNWYSAALYVGDTYSRLKDYANSAAWYAKAVAIDPDRETAYRYWGDNLLATGDMAGARLKFEQAFVAEPYSGSGMSGLRNWSIKTRTSLVAPSVPRPGILNWNGKPEEDLSQESGNGHSSWDVYRRSRQSHGKDVVLNQWVMAGSVPAGPSFDFAPTGYVHSLSEEVEAINAMLADIKQKLASGALTQEKLEPGLKTLLQLQKDHMLEPFILLNFNDAGLRHGYPTYRATHHEELAAYVDKYLIGPPMPANTPNPYVMINP